MMMVTTPYAAPPSRRARKSIAFPVCVAVGVAVFFVYVYIVWQMISTYSEPDHKLPQMLRQIKSVKTTDSALLENEVDSVVSYHVHAFYYPWYGNPQFDEGQYYHWNHPWLPHWDKRIAKQYPTKGHHDPTHLDLGSSYYPQLGPYSSADPSIIQQHLAMLQLAGIGVAVVSWLPAHQHDDNGPPIAERLGQILDLALSTKIRIAVHMEPYDKRTIENVKQDIQELMDAHGNHPALFRMQRPTTGSDKELPLLYFYDQYRLPAAQWQELLTEIRGTEHDVVALCLIVEQNHWYDYVTYAGFDGGYTYFASNTFTYGSRPSNWKDLQQHATAEHKLFVPSVGPGYDDTRVRPWNKQNTHERDKGAYFNAEWQAALNHGAQFVSITSFNEWHEGTQIEPAVPMTSGASDGYRYRDYAVEGGPQFYLDRNREWVLQFMKQQQEQQ